ncbi:hypothetical protein AUC71_02295 [Methyloceanibacter marginalis]|jgi:hypothetical protein|uniref:Uncharacterized protein n=1 Tax=Methyloceanibacter marginalis TaxID=1774971 RepID=A0A1E3W8H4_9HYPH|nr:hypothetical protein [Methyloceanibacter marginalis]ODS02114.1 hypothetical protein AUC71_02295 [Methyloceanibacter marginalis]
MTSNRSSAMTIGIAATVLWFGFLAVYLGYNLRDVFGLEPDAFGDFLAGWFAPPAFFWLMITVWLQREELAAQREELARSTSVLEAQAKASQVDLLFGIDEFYAQRLSYHLDHILTSSGLYDSDAQRDRTWDLFSRGNRLIIARHLLNMLKQPGEEAEAREALQTTLAEGGLKANNLSHSLATYARLVEDYKRKIAALGEQPEETGFSEFVDIADQLGAMQAEK